MITRYTPPTPITITGAAEYLLGREARTGGDFEQAGLPMFFGCQCCGASLGPWNAYPSTTGYIRCAACIDEQGYASGVAFCRAAGLQPRVDKSWHGWFRIVADLYGLGAWLDISTHIRTGSESVGARP